MKVRRIAKARNRAYYEALPLALKLKKALQKLERVLRLPLGFTSLNTDYKSNYEQVEHFFGERDDRIDTLIKQWECFNGRTPTQACAPHNA